VVALVVGITLFAVGVALFAALLPLLILAAIVLLPMLAIGTASGLAFGC
jgi:hypothetical protein